MSAPCPTLGFHVAFTIAPAAVESRRAALRAAFLQVVATNGLVCTASAAGPLAYIVTGDGTQATDADRARLLAWLDDQPEIAMHRVGPLTDVSERV
jgi:uncharacterized protein YggL (DUF469 family)